MMVNKWTCSYRKTYWRKNRFYRFLYAITDEQAVAYIDGQIKFIGGKPETFGKSE